MTTFDSSNDSSSWVGFLMRDCCQSLANLDLVLNEPTRTIRRCRVCGASHYELLAEPIRFGATGAPVGG